MAFALPQVRKAIVVAPHVTLEVDLPVATLVASGLRGQKSRVLCPVLVPPLDVVELASLVVSVHLCQPEVCLPCQPEVCPLRQLEVYLLSHPEVFLLSANDHRWMNRRPESFENYYEFRDHPSDDNACGTYLSEFAIGLCDRIGLVRIDVLHAFFHRHPNNPRTYGLIDVLRHFVADLFRWLGVTRE